LKDIDAELKRKSKAIEQEVETRITAITTQAKYNIEKDLNGDVKRLAWRWGGAILAGLIIGCLVVWFGVSTLLPQMIASYSNVNELVQKEIKVNQMDNLGKLFGRLSTQDAEIQVLKRRLWELEKKQVIYPPRTGP
jgi:hypothetical protein